MISLIRAAVDRGITFFDTAEVYGHSQTRNLWASPGPGADRVVIATKFASIRMATAAWAQSLNSRPEHIKLVAEASLQRLKPMSSTCFISTASIRKCPSKRLRRGEELIQAVR